MTKHTRSARSIPCNLRRAATVAAVAAGVLASSLAVGTTALAQSPNGPGKRFPDAPIPFDPIVADDIKLPPIAKSSWFNIPLPCFGWWCEIPLLPLPDYEASFDNISSLNGWYEGQRAVPYYVSINNVGNGDPGAVWTTLASRDGEILGVEPVGSWRTDISAQPVAWTARWTAPHATSFLDDAWVVQDTNGIPADSGYADKVYVRVWMAGWDRPELIVSANEHVGVDQLGALTPSNYRHNEVTRSNNRIEFNL